MQTQIRQNGNSFICAVTGDVDMYSAPALHKTWLDHAAIHAQSPFIIDLEATEYLDSSGIGVFVQIFADARTRKTPFCICHVRGMAEKLMHLSRMSTILPIEKTLDDAMRKIGA